MVGEMRWNMSNQVFIALMGISTIVIIELLMKGVW